MQNFLKSKLLLLRPTKIVCSINTLGRYYDDYEIKMLADNISANGIIEPLIVTENESGKYELVAGLKRLKAAMLLGLRRVPCLLINASPEDMAFISLSENIKRTNLNYFEEAEAIKKVINRFDTTNTVVSDRLGISSSALLNKLNLLKIDNETRKRIIKSGLSERHARIVLLIPQEKQNLFLDKVIKEELSIGETRELAERFLFGEETQEISSDKPLQPIRKAVIGDVRLFSNSLSKLIDAMKNTGVEAYSRKIENDKFIEYRVRIVKPQSENYQQLKLV